MKRVLFDAWLSALRKPEVWRQGFGSLEDEGCFCALGILLRVDRWTRGLARVVESGGGVHYTYQGISMHTMVSDNYRQAAGLSYDLAESVIVMNDMEHTPLPKIAEWLDHRRHLIVTK